MTKLNTQASIAVNGHCELNGRPAPLTVHRWWISRYYRVSEAIERDAVVVGLGDYC